MDNNENDKDKNWIIYADNQVYRDTSINEPLMYKNQSMINKKIRLSNRLENKIKDFRIKRDKLSKKRYNQIIKILENIKEGSFDGCGCFEECNEFDDTLYTEWFSDNYNLEINFLNLPIVPELYYNEQEVNIIMFSYYNSSYLDNDTEFGKFESQLKGVKDYAKTLEKVYLLGSSLLKLGYLGEFDEGVSTDKPNESSYRAIVKNFNDVKRVISDFCNTDILGE